MSCKDIEEKLDAYLDGELSTEERKPISAHLEVCPLCREHANQVMEIITLVKSLPAPEPRACLSDDLMGRLMEEEEKAPLLTRMLKSLADFGLILTRSPAFYGTILLCIAGRFGLSPPVDSNGEFSCLNNPSYVSALSQKEMNIDRKYLMGGETPDASPQNRNNKKEDIYDVHKEDLFDRIAVYRAGSDLCPGGPGDLLHIHYTQSL